MKRVFLAVLLLSAAALAGERSLRWIKSSYISDGSVAVSCKNGADPTGVKYGDTLIISCGVR